MSEVDWARVAEVFADALEVAPEERAAFVAMRCEGSPAEEEAILRMLSARDSADSGFLEGMDPEHLEAVLGELDTPLARIGPWRLVRGIGRGGMGEVFLAERADGQFEQQVAVKLLKRGMDSDAILARFLRERQILAGLDHPNIARLLDGGIAGDGRPYFVMEYVDGEPITAFADAQRLSIDERLALFQPVCEAVAYAHRSLVVHRDLKPSNILVSADGRPKLLDFGIAKLLSATDGATEATTLTTDGLRLLTPAYAAPEQIHGFPVTTSTDVYGLGAVLFELLSGRRPFGDASDRLRLPSDTEPMALSSAVLGKHRAQGDEGDTTSPEDAAAARSTDPPRLARRLAGDLETIVGTALRSVPERRYASVGALQEDLRRHRERLPVRARPDTVGYRVSRFVRRHPWGVLSAGAMAMVVTAFAIIAGLQAHAVALQRDRATREAAAAREVSEFLVGVFEVADPMLPGYGDSVRATDLLERGAGRIETELVGQPAVQGRIMEVIGRAYANLGQNDRAERLLARAVEIDRTAAESDGEDLVRALQQLAGVQSAGRDPGTAETIMREAIDIQRSIDPESVAMWSLLVDLAYVIHATGDFQRGNAAAADALALFRRLPEEDLGEARWQLGRMASLLSGNEAGAQDSVFARMVRIESRRSGEISVPVATAFSTWASAKGMAGDFAAADTLDQRSLDIYVALDPNSLATAGALHDQADKALRMGDYVRSDSLIRRAIGIRVDRQGPDHLEVAHSRAVLADVLEHRGMLDEAIEVRRLANATLERENDVLLPVSQARLGATLRDVGRYREAIEQLESALRIFGSRYPPGYILTANARRDYGQTLVEVGRAAEAEPVLRQAIQALGDRWGVDDFRVDIARVSLGRALGDLGRGSEAQEVLGPVLERFTESRGPDDEWTRRAQEALDELRDPAPSFVP